jgi:hypothetical protein
MCPRPYRAQPLLPSLASPTGPAGTGDRRRQPEAVPTALRRWASSSQPTNWSAGIGRAMR